MVFTRRFRKRFMHPQAENDAMVDLESAIKELRNALRDRGIPNDELKKIKTEVKVCNFASSIHHCIEHILSGFKEDKEIISLLCAANTALLVYHDLRFDRAMEDFRRGLARGLWPGWYQDYKQQRVEHYRRCVKYCLKWTRVTEKVRFQLILKEDKLNQQEEQNENTTLRREKLCSIKEEEDEETSEPMQPVECQVSQQDGEMAAAAESTQLVTYKGSQLVVYQGPSSEKETELSF